MSPIDRRDPSEAAVLKQAWLAVAAGAVVFWVATFAGFVLVDADWWSGTTAERAAVIDEHITAWRTTWTVTMPGELLVGAGLIAIGRTFARRAQGARRLGWAFIAVAGGAHLPIAVARFATSLSDGAYAADPGLWFEVLWGAHFFALVAGSLVLAWLGFGRLAPRWASVVLAVFALLAVPAFAPSPAYLPGLTVFAVAAWWRLRSPQRSEALTPVAA